MSCQDETRCGRPQEGPGHPRHGWIRTHVAGTKDSTRWWCSIACLAARFHATTPRHDVATCARCINRHDRDHRCPACGTRPQVATGVATPPAHIPRPLLYQDLGYSR